MRSPARAEESRSESQHAYPSAKLAELATWTLKLEKTLVYLRSPGTLPGAFLHTRSAVNS